MRARNLYNEPIKKIAEFLRVGEQTAKAVRTLVRMEGDYNISRFDVADFLESLRLEKTLRFVENDSPRLVSKHDYVFNALDELIGGYGIEVIYEADSPSPLPSEFKRLPEYINTGDTYNPTIIYYKGKYSLGCWGDWAEWMESRKED